MTGMLVTTLSCLHASIRLLTCVSTQVPNLGSCACRLGIRDLRVHQLRYVHVRSSVASQSAQKTIRQASPLLRTNSVKLTSSDSGSNCYRKIDGTRVQTTEEGSTGLYGVLADSDMMLCI
jgi:hypothetical protein